MVWRGIGEKYGQRVSHGNGNDEFGRQDAWPYGADPRTEVPPDRIGAKDRERLEKALCDAPELDVGVISADLATDLIAIGLRLTVQILVS